MKRGLMLLLLLAPLAASADTVVLKGGRRLTGVLVEKTARSVVLEVGPGRVSVPASQVESIESGTSALAAYRGRAAQLRAEDAQGWLELAFWARDSGLETQAQDAFARVLTADPDNASAHAALGHVRLGTRWATAEESYRAQGLVPFEGAWISPAERQALLRERAEAAVADRARLEADARAREADARARQAEADARRAEADQADSGWGTGFPYGYVFGGGCSGWNCGRLGSSHIWPNHPGGTHTRPPAPPVTPAPQPPPVTGSIH